jgi:transposase
MSSEKRFIDEFKVALPRQLLIAVSEVTERLGVSIRSLNSWKVQFVKLAKAREVEPDLALEIRRVKKGLGRVKEERDILKRATTYSTEKSRLDLGSSIRVFISIIVSHADGPLQQFIFMAKGTVEPACTGGCASDRFHPTGLDRQ